MVAYSLTGMGVQALTAGTRRLFIDVTALPGDLKFGTANPTNYYHLGLIRAGVLGHFADPVPIEAVNAFLDLPSGTDSIGYSLHPGAVISVAEDALPPPPGGTFIGTSTIGTAGSDNLNGTFSFCRSPVQLAAAGSISQISAYITGVTGSPEIHYAIYSDFAGAPHALLAQTSIGVVPSVVPGWLSIPISLAVGAATTYWLAAEVLNGASGTLDANYAYDNPPGGALELQQGSKTEPLFEDPAPATTGFAERVSIYAS